MRLGTAEWELLRTWQGWGARLWGGGSEDTRTRKKRQGKKQGSNGYLIKLWAALLTLSGKGGGSGATAPGVSASGAAGAGGRRMMHARVCLELKKWQGGERGSEGNARKCH